jgi:hypothetical protein
MPVVDEYNPVWLAIKVLMQVVLVSLCILE